MDDYINDQLPADLEFQQYYDFSQVRPHLAIIFALLMLRVQTQFTCTKFVSFFKSFIFTG